MGSNEDSKPKLERTRRSGGRRDSLTSAANNRPKHLSASMPAAPGGLSMAEAVDAYEEKIRRKLEEAGGPSNAGVESKFDRPSRSSSMPDAVDSESAFEERLKRKMAEGANTNRPKHLSSSMPVGSDPKAAYEEKLRRKMADGAKKHLKWSMPAGEVAVEKRGGTVTHLDARDSFDERLRRKAAGERPRNLTSSMPESFDSMKIAKKVAQSFGMDDDATAQTNVSVGQEDYFAVTSVNFEEVFRHLIEFTATNSSSRMPVSHPSFSHIMDALTAAGVEDLLKKRWDYQMAGLKAFKREHGDCMIPESHPTLGQWARTQAELYTRHELGESTPLTKKRYNKLHEFGFDEFIRWERSKGKGDNVQPKDQSIAVKVKKGHQKESSNGSEKEKFDEEEILDSSSYNGDEAEDTAPPSLRLDEEIWMRKKKNRVSFLERGLKAHSKGPHSKGSRKTQEAREKEKEAIAKELHSKRMVLRSARRGLGTKLSRQVTEDVVKDSNRDSDSGDGIKDDGTSTVRRKRRTIDKYSYIMLSCSSTNLVPHSWECKNCSYINEPVGFDRGIICKGCKEPKDKEKSMNMGELMLHQASKDDLAVESWGELDSALLLAQTQSMAFLNQKNRAHESISKWSNDKTLRNGFDG